MPKIYTKNNWVDEIITGAERYNILEDGGAAFKSNMQVNLANSVSVAGSPVNAARMNNLENGVDALDTLLASFENYVITPSITTNNLVMEIKTLAGGNPSATDKARFKVGNTVYSLATALSFTKNAATNWMNMGGGELATKDVDLFMYAIGETGASAGLKFGYSRVPYALTMGDFINVSTDEKYIAGNWTNFNSTDKVQVIGRFRARLSAGAGYTWSIPSSKVINYPTYETDWLSYAPQDTGYSVNPTYTAVYKVVGDVVFNSRLVTANGTSNAVTATTTVPFKVAETNNMLFWLGANDNGVLQTTPGHAQSSSGSNVLNLWKLFFASGWTASGTKAQTLPSFFFKLR